MILERSFFPPVFVLSRLDLPLLEVHDDGFLYRLLLNVFVLCVACVPIKFFQTHSTAPFLYIRCKFCSIYRGWRRYKFQPFTQDVCFVFSQSTVRQIDYRLLMTSSAFGVAAATPVHTPMSFRCGCLWRFVGLYKRRSIRVGSGELSAGNRRFAEMYARRCIRVGSVGLDSENLWLVGLCVCRCVVVG